MTTPAAEPRIRELMLENLFVVVNERDPSRRLEAIARNYTEDVIWSAPTGLPKGPAMNEQAQTLPVLHTLLTAQR